MSQRKVSFPRTQQNAGLKPELLDAEPSAVTKRSLHLPSKRFYVSLKMVDFFKSKQSDKKHTEIYMFAYSFFF